MFKNILFDLDGTLTDPKVGITTCIAYALNSFGITVESLDDLEHFIGPPLKEQFMESYGFDDRQAEQAVGKYRERFAVKGMYENEVYDGIEELLQALKAEGKVLGVASSKPEVFVNEILKHFHLDGYFDCIAGADMEGKRTEKEAVVADALQRLGITENEKPKTVMIGDRKYDVLGAKAHGLASIGVVFGYGGYEELQHAGADQIAMTVAELRTAIGG